MVKNEQSELAIDFIEYDYKIKSRKNRVIRPNKLTTEPIWKN